MVRITHSKVSGKPQGQDPTRIYGNHWDADHVVEGLDIGADVQAHDATLDGLSGKASTGTGAIVLADAPTLTSVTVDTVNGVAISGSGSADFGPGGTVAYTEDKLSAFAATTSAELKSVISDETGSGALVFGTSPNITAPTGIVKGDVGLGDADNTSDADKPISGATQTALDEKVTGPASVTDDLPAIFDGTTGKLLKAKTYAAFKTLLALVKGDVGLGNVDNTSDATKNAATVTLTNKTISGASNTLTVREADLSTTDITAGNVSTAKHGFAPKLPNDATRYLDGTGGWSAPSGGGGGAPTDGSVVAASISEGTDEQDAIVTKLRIQALIDDTIGAAINKIFGVEPAISRWNTAKAGSRVYYAGSNGTPAGGGASGGTTAVGRTFVDTAVGTAIRQDGFVRSVDIFMTAAGTLPNSLKFKVLRPNGSSYTKVSESEFITPSGTGLRTYNLAMPMACRPGDRIGLWIKGDPTNGPIFGTSAGGSCAFTGSDAVGGESYTAISGATMVTTFKGVPPFIVTAGESLLAGHNTASIWNTLYEGGPSGNLDADPMHTVRGTYIPALEYQNFCEGGTTTNQTLVKIPAIAAIAPRVVVFGVGVNDVTQGRTWSQIESDLNGYRAGLPADTRIFLIEILPYTTSSDTQAALIRTYNANYIMWCASNGATLISAHDALATIRSSTGQFDDLNSTYANADGVHLNAAGVPVYAERIATGLKNASWF